MAIERTVLLLAHGSRLPESAEHIIEIADRLRERLPGRVVRVAYLELVSPLLPDAIDACVGEGAEEVLVQPYLLTPGRHSVRDVPDQLSAASQRHPHVRFLLGEVLGVDDGLVELVARRVSAAEPFATKKSRSPEADD